VTFFVYPIRAKISKTCLLAVFLVAAGHFHLLQSVPEVPQRAGVFFFEETTRQRVVHVPRHCADHKRVNRFGDFAGLPNVQCGLSQIVGEMFDALSDVLLGEYQDLSLDSGDHVGAGVDHTFGDPCGEYVQFRGQL
jgi:hypothetical protein